MLESYSRQAGIKVKKEKLSWSSIAMMRKNKATQERRKIHSSDRKEGSEKGRTKP